MGIFNWFSGLFGDDSSGSGIDDTDIETLTDDIFDNSINPANGLPMVDGIGGIDVEGNSYGTDFSNDDTFGTSSSFDDSFSSGSSFDDW